MKIWIEFPENTFFARQGRDILYTPIYFANETISAHIRFDKEWRNTYGEDLDQHFGARVKLIGKASLGFLSIGGDPISGAETHYVIPNLGFKAIYTLEILNIVKRVSLAGLEYNVDDGLRDGRKAFHFNLPTSTLDDLQQLASSLKIISADNVSTMGLLKGITPALIVNVQYAIVAEIVDQENQIKAVANEELRLFVSLSEEQVPSASHPAVASNPMATFVTNQIVPMGVTRARRGSVPLIRRLSRTSVQDTNMMNVDIESTEPFAFTRNSDAAASRVTISLLYSTESSDPPAEVYAGIQWMLKCLTTLTLEPMDREENPDQADDFFHLRSKILPSRKLKMKFSDWQQLSAPDEGRVRWKSTQKVYLVKDITAGMTPTFVTPYLSHVYTLNLVVSLHENEAKAARGLSGGKQKAELEVPIQVRYDLGLVPSYEVDETLPEYDHTLPEYEEPGEGDPAGEGASASTETDSNALPDLANLNIDFTPSQEGSAPDFPPRQLAHSPISRPST